MKINITYSIDSDEIPDKVKGFLTKAAEASRSVDAEINYVISLIEHDSSLREQLSCISKIREQLENVNSILLDCSQILHGYEEVLAEQPQTMPVWPMPTNEKDLNVPENDEQIKILSEQLKTLEKVYHDNKTRNEEAEEG